MLFRVLDHEKQRKEERAVSCHILFLLVVHDSIELTKLTPLIRDGICDRIYTQVDVTFFVCIYKARGASGVPRVVGRQLSEVADMGLPFVPPPPFLLPPAFSSKV